MTPTTTNPLVSSSSSVDMPGLPLAEPCHTPGPWTVFDNGEEVGVFAARADVAHCHGFDSMRSPDEVRANAHLIAAAPELFAALRLALAHADTLQCSAWVGPASAAIAKALGISRLEGQGEGGGDG